MAAAELTLADLHALVQAQIVAAEAMKTAGQCNTDNIAAINTALDKLSASHKELAQSQKTMETNLTNQLSTSHNELSQANNKMDSTLSRLITSTTLEQSSPPPSTAPRDAHLRTGLLRPNGHGSATLHQGHNSRVIQTSDCPLVRGENSNSNAHIHTDFNHEFEPPDSPDHNNHHHERNYYSPRLPKSNFPKFDGDNPKWWKEQSEKYFKMYNVQPEMWVDFATMHFHGNAALWLQTYEARQSIASWAALCVGIFTKFNRNKYAKLMDDFFAFNQLASVDEYAHKFEENMHKILVYNHSYDETFFVNRFVEGLKPEIRSVIKLHQPSTVDLAFSLAQTQEALLVEDTAISSKKYEHKSKDHKSSQYTGILGNYGTEKVVEDKGKTTSPVDSLHAQRKARGECFRCGEKYAPGHRCPKQIQLHVIDELFDALQISNEEVSADLCHSDDSSCDDELDKPTTPDDDNLMKLAVDPKTGFAGKKSIRLQGLIGKHHVLILIDSGSSSNFINSELVKILSCPVDPIPSAKVVVAGGGTLQCSSQVNDLLWLTQGNNFTTTLKILPLGSYDIILGKDWLESIGKMWVDWKKKTLRFRHGLYKNRITLRGIKDNTEADALSRSTSILELNAISTCQPKWLQCIAKRYLKRDEDKQLLAELSLTGKTDKGYTLHEAANGTPGGKEAIRTSICGGSKNWGSGVSPEAPCIKSNSSSPACIPTQASSAY